MKNLLVEEREAHTATKDKLKATLDLLHSKEIELLDTNESLRAEIEKLTSKLKFLVLLAMGGDV